MRWPLIFMLFDYSFASGVLKVICLLIRVFFFFFFSSLSKYTQQLFIKSPSSNYDCAHLFNNHFLPFFFACRSFLRLRTNSNACIASCNKSIFLLHYKQIKLILHKTVIYFYRLYRLVDCVAQERKNNKVNRTHNNVNVFV
jgi:hypothetical protein